MRTMPVLETERLRIRPFTPDDLHDTIQTLTTIGWVDESQTEAEQHAAIEKYVQWSSLNHTQLAQIGQPPYGERVIALKQSNQMIGTCGYVPCIDNYSMYPYFGGRQDGLATAEVGLLWTIHSNHQQQGYGAEAARALIAYAFDGLNLHHIIATTSYDNIASQKVMQKAGMWLERNPYDDPPWLQIVGIAENPKVKSDED